MLQLKSLYIAEGVKCALSASTLRFETADTTTLKTSYDLGNKALYIVKDENAPPCQVAIPFTGVASLSSLELVIMGKNSSLCFQRLPPLQDESLRPSPFGCWAGQCLSITMHNGSEIQELPSLRQTLRITYDGNVKLSGRGSLANVEYVRSWRSITTEVISSSASNQIIVTDLPTIVCPMLNANGRRLREDADDFVPRVRQRIHPPSPILLPTGLEDVDAVALLVQTHPEEAVMRIVREAEQRIMTLLNVKGFLRAGQGAALFRKLLEENPHYSRAMVHKPNVDIQIARITQKLEKIAEREQSAPPLPFANEECPICKDANSVFRMCECRVGTICEQCIDTIIINDHSQLLRSCFACRKPLSKKPFEALSQ